MRGRFAYARAAGGSIPSTPTALTCDHGCYLRLSRSWLAVSWHHPWRETSAGPAGFGYQGPPEVTGEATVHDDRSIWVRVVSVSSGVLSTAHEALYPPSTTSIDPASHAASSQVETSDLERQRTLSQARFWL